MFSSCMSWLRLRELLYLGSHHSVWELPVSGFLCPACADWGCCQPQWRGPHVQPPAAVTCPPADLSEGRPSTVPTMGHPGCCRTPDHSPELHSWKRHRQKHSDCWLSHLGPFSVSSSEYAQAVLGQSQGRLLQYSNLACDWLSIVWAYSKQETENGPWSYLFFPPMGCAAMPGQTCQQIWSFSHRGHSSCAVKCQPSQYMGEVTKLHLSHLSLHSGHPDWAVTLGQTYLSFFHRGHPGCAVTPGQTYQSFSDRGHPGCAVTPGQTYQSFSDSSHPGCAVTPGQTYHSSDSSHPGCAVPLTSLYPVWVAVTVQSHLGSSIPPHGSGHGPPPVPLHEPPRWHLEVAVYFIVTSTQHTCSQGLHGEILTHWPLGDFN